MTAGIESLSARADSNWACSDVNEVHLEFETRT